MNDDIEFEVKIDFEKSSRNPSRVFYGMGDFIDSFSLIDESLLSVFNVNFDSHVELCDVKTGSVRAQLKRVLNAIDDDALKDGDWKKVVGGFLHEGKQSLLKWCDEKEEVSNLALIQEGAKQINLLAESTDLQHLPCYTDFSDKDFITCIQSIQKAGSSLNEKDVVTYHQDDDVSEINTKVYFSDELIEEVFNEQPETDRQNAIVTIKKPDYLGDSQWELKLNGKTIYAHILDLDWLSSFQKRQFEIRPGDSLRVILEVTFSYKGKSTPTVENYEVVEVLGIVQGISEKQDKWI